MTIKTQQALVRFLMKYPDTWHSYANDKKTVSLVCATSNLGILKVNNNYQMKLKSRDAAHQFLFNR